jgi:uncharacterized membrane protein
MSTIPETEIRSTSFVQPKRLVFGGIWLMFAYVLYHNERFLIEPSDPSWPHYRDLGWWLLVHGVVGMTALILIFMQFNDGLRARHPALHRVCGRIYMCCVLIAAPLGVYIAQQDGAIGYDFSFTLSTVVLAALWIFASGMAFYCIRTRRIDQHRQWMTRSLAMAMVFLEDRVVAGLTGWEDSQTADTLVIWACVALGYPLADAALQLEDFLRERRPKPIFSGSAS